MGSSPLSFASSGLFSSPASAAATTTGLGTIHRANPVASSSSLL
jgi:hypothetical protein